MKIKERFFIFGVYAFLILFTLSVLFPLLYVLQMTFSGDINYEFRLLPKKLTLMHYTGVFKSGLITKPFCNSTVVTAMSVIISMILTPMMAYPLSVRNLVGRKFLNYIIMLPMTFSLGFMPTYLLIKELGLMDSYWALILPGAISTYNMIIMRNFFSSIPESLFESARLDGATEMKILWKIVMPLSKAATATVGLFYFVSNWNEYFNVILYIRTRSKQTLQVVLRQMIINGEGLRNADDLYQIHMQYTVVMITILPVLAVYPFVQRYFTKGIMIGSVKG